MLTIEEQERAAYAAGNTALADALAIIIDLENQACELRDIIRDARGEIDPEKTDWHLGWHERATAALGD
jgi:hypothetical protein